MTGVPPLVDAARKLRGAMSLPEVLLWQELRKRPGDLKFRRQHAIGDYVLDFYCAAAKLAIEIDGRAHDGADRPQRDEARDAWLAARGVRTVRIAAPRVLADPASVAMWLVMEAGASAFDRPSTMQEHGPPPRKGGEDQFPGLPA